MTARRRAGPCPNCGTADPRPFLSRPATRPAFGDDDGMLHFHRCRTCDLVYQDPVPDQAKLAEYYSVPVDWERWKEKELLGLSGHLRTCRFYADMIDQAVDLPPEGSAFDIGCGYGGFLYVMKRRGWRVDGNEYRPETRRFGKEILDVDIRLGDFLDLDVPDGQDLVTALQLIEHVMNAEELLRRIHDRLRPGGVVALGTPDVDSLTRRIFGARWTYFIDHHTVLYNAVSMRYILERSGFEVVRIFEHALYAWGRRPWLQLPRAVLRSAVRRRWPATWHTAADGIVAVARKPG